MATATVTVQYVNQPKEGQRKGSIKTTDGSYYGVWPDKLGLFTKGGTYQIEFTETVSDSGKVFRDFKQMVGAPTQGGYSGPRRGSNGGNYRPTAPQDAERMFVCSILNAFAQSDTDVRLDEGLVDHVNTLRHVWQETFGQDVVGETRQESAARIVQQPARPTPMASRGQRDDMDDEIPY